MMASRNLLLFVTLPSAGGEMSSVDAANTKYMLEIMSKLGWIDASRFGRSASMTAFLLVQHSGNLPLMLAALPEIEKDVRSGRISGSAYALLYDRTQLALGRRQRYGSQVMLVKGQYFVQALEDRSKVDEFRRQLSLEPLAEYLDFFQKQTPEKEIGYIE